MSRLKLTDRFISSCPIPTVGRVEHSDSICPGLYLRVSSGGVKSFSIIVRQGRLIRTTLGRYPVLTLAEARNAAMRLMRELAETPLREGQGGQQAAAPAFADLVANYADLHLKPNLRSWKNVLASLSQPALGHLRGREVTMIEKREVVAVLDGIVAEGKPHSAVNLLKALRAMFNWAIDRGDMAVNPCDRVRPPAATTQRDRVLTDAEIVGVLGACDSVPTPFGAMVRVLLHTGARRNEVAHMRWSEITGNVWTLPAERSKSGRANSLPLPPEVMAILANLPRYDDNAFVFTTTKGKKPASDFAKRKRLLDVASGTSDWHLHDLRRTCRSKLAELGVSREVARRVIGHSVDQLDAIYDRFSYAEKKAQALALLADHLAVLAAQSAK